MPARITENWTARKYKRGVSAFREFMITGVTDEEAARAACPFQPGSSFTYDARLKAQEPDMVNAGNGEAWTAGVNFVRPTSGSTGGGTNIDLKPQYKLEITMSREPMDFAYDAEDNIVAVVNSARDAFETAPTGPTNRIRFLYRRWQSSFDGPLAIAYSGRATNIDTFELPRFGTIEPGQAFCEQITMSDWIDADTDEIQVVTALELRKDGFLTRILDQGTRAAYNDSGTTRTGQLSDKNKQRVGFQVRLNGAGAPRDADSYTVFSDDGETEYPIISLGSAPAGAEVEDTDDATFLKYRQVVRLPFAALLLTE